MKENHLNNSPIREAVIDFRFDFVEPVDINKLDAAHKKLISLYPIKEVIDMNSLFFDMRASNKPILEHTQGKVGYRFISNEKDIIVQFRIDGFTFSKLKPYTSWEEILEKVKEAYSVYIETVKIKKVVRIATRYINFINLEKDEIIDIKKYFNISPNIPEEITSPIDNYLMRVSFKDAETNMTSIINQGIVSEKNIKDSEIIKSFILDIDCFRENLSLNSDALWSSLSEIKEHTNEIFFSSITDITKEKFK